MSENRQHGTYETARWPQRCRIVRGVYKQQHIFLQRTANITVRLPPSCLRFSRRRRRCCRRWCLSADEITLAPYVYPACACPVVLARTATAAVQHQPISSTTTTAARHHTAPVVVTHSLYLATRQSTSTRQHRATDADTRRATSYKSSSSSSSDNYKIYT